MITRVEFTLDNPQIMKERIHILHMRGIFPEPEAHITIDSDIIGEDYKITDTDRDVAHIHLTDWFRRHPNLNIGDKLAFDIIAPKSHYRLTILTPPVKPAVKNIN